MGQQADFVVLDASHPLLDELPTPDAMLSAHAFASHRQSAIAAVWTAGRRRVQSGYHALHAQARHAFTRARAALPQMPLD